MYFLWKWSSNGPWQILIATPHLSSVSSSLLCLPQIYWYFVWSLYAVPCTKFCHNQAMEKDPNWIQQWTCLNNEQLWKCNVQITCCSYVYKHLMENDCLQAFNGKWLWSLSGQAIKKPQKRLLISMEINCHHFAVCHNDMDVGILRSLQCRLLQSAIVKNINWLICGGY